MFAFIRKTHLHMNNFDKIKVKLATQVSSHSCSAAIKMLHEKNLFSENSKVNEIPTSNVLKRMVSIFDCLNCLIFLYRLLCSMNEKN